MGLSTKICSVSNATLNRFFSLHYILPFVLAALVVAHLIALHINGSNNPNGVQNGGDRYTFYPYFIFKDLVTIFAFFLVLSIFVFYYPNAMGQRWPYIMLLIVFIIYICAISWKYTLNNYLVKIYNKTILLSDLFNLLSFSLGQARLARLTVSLILKFSNWLTKPSCPVLTHRKATTLLKIIITINPNIVISYYEVYNQQITKVLLFICNFNFIRKLRSQRLSLKITMIRIRVGISETIRTQKKIITNKFLKDNISLLHSLRPSYSFKVDICSSLYHPSAAGQSFPYGAEQWQPGCLSENGLPLRSSSISISSSSSSSSYSSSSKAMMAGAQTKHPLCSHYTCSATQYFSSWSCGGLRPAAASAKQQHSSGGA